uniref:RING-type E3 ubiquitin transferase n=1 Tax=Chenopodium quinoa TaxID=63459 RepID=A0A803KZA4_CHEQI
MDLIVVEDDHGSYSKPITSMKEEEKLYVAVGKEVQAEKLHIEMDSVEQGILQLIAEHNIEKLVMGAAQDDCYQMKMMEPVSKKAIYVQLHAPAKCHIWFICKGHLIHQRKFSSEERIHAQNERSINSNFLSVNGQSNKSIIGKKELIFGEGSSQFDTSNGRFTDLSSMDNIKTHVSLPEFDLEANCYDWGEFLEQNHQRHLSSSHSDAQEISSGAYAEAERKCKELEEELEKLKNDRDKLREKYQDAMDQNLVLEGKVANYDQVLKELEEGFISNVELLQVCEKDRDDLKIERDSVLKTAEELLNQSAEAASKSDDLRFFTTFTFAEIERATNDFDPSFQLWEGENGSIYKGVISHTQVTIKMWRPEGLQGPQEFHREVEILSKFRHPNVVTLMGVCPEAWAIVYEFLPNGSLQERLNSTGDTDNIPLSWQTRIRIATELCCVLIFLHCHGPERVVHGALNPTSIYLDSNFTCKISDFGTELSNSSSYTDPEYIMTEVATPAMDVYSFGLILLELLTGKPASDITYELEDALNENSFDTLLDSSAGDWPFVQAEQLARLALRCCEENASDRPDLESDVWRILEPMRTSCGGSTSYHLGDEHRQAPSYFICPIFQEVMKDPHVAADGYTYEAEALQGWLDGDHDTSPMTNLQLEHCNLVPNHALRSAIQEWRQRH